MIEARTRREQELTDLIQYDRPKLVSLYREVTLREQAIEHPDFLTCLGMIQQIVDVELPPEGA